ncbi:MAG: response regulator [Myxococcales bacterium]|nr:response regulator [Myxococcales bacterium]
MNMNKILLVDDSKVALFSERIMLERSGLYEIVVARDGDEVLDMVEAEDPDLIVMDVIMPTMSGFEACRALRAQPQTKDIPVILVTTRGEACNIEEGYASGCNDYVTKPVDGPELLRKIENLI